MLSLQAQWRTERLLCHLRDFTVWKDFSYSEIDTWHLHGFLILSSHKYICLLFSVSPTWCFIVIIHLFFSTSAHSIRKKRSNEKNQHMECRWFGSHCWQGHKVKLQAKLPFSSHRSSLCSLFMTLRSLSITSEHYAWAQAERKKELRNFKIDNCLKWVILSSTTTHKNVDSFIKSNWWKNKTIIKKNKHKNKILLRALKATLLYALCL